MTPVTIPRIRLPLVWPPDKQYSNYMEPLRKMIIANWKSNKNMTAATEWVDTFLQQDRKAVYEYIVCPPTPLLAAVQPLVAAHVQLGVQDLSPFGAGAYTGEVAPENMTGLNVRYAILGHSERRKYLHETSQLVAKKVSSALEAGITPIVCVDREQFQEQADQMDARDRERIIVAYEPVHAISTFGGEQDPIEVTLETIQQAHDIFGANTPILYGGSTNRDNSLQYLKEDSIAGILVGGASLDAEHFAQL